MPPVERASSEPHRAGANAALPTTLIEVRLRNISQVFNSMDPSPFHEKDLDADAEEFIISWAMECPMDQPIALVVHVEEPPAQADAERIVAEAVHHFFDHRAQLKRRELRELLRRGRVSLLIGIAFLAGCTVLGSFLESFSSRTFSRLVQESLLIGGWVAMWRPLEIFLYDWWPVRRMQRLFAKMSTMQVRVRIGTDTPSANPPMPT